MAIDKSRLSEFLNTQPLMLEEKKMWYRLGFYVFPNPNATNRYGNDETYLVDSMGNKEAIDKTVAFNLRVAALSWWEVEAVKPRANEKEKTTVVASSDSLDELESSRG